MNQQRTKASRAILATVAGVAALLAGDASPIISGSIITPAHAIRGRPLTPMSYAGLVTPMVE